MMDNINGALASTQVLVCAKELMEYPSNSTIRKIADAVGGVNGFCHLPVLYWREGFDEEAIGYSMVPKDLSAPIMRGVDPWGRPYVTILTKTERTVNGQISLHFAVETLFQRYPDLLDPWTSGGHHHFMPMARSIVNDKTIDQLRDLASGKSLEWYWENVKMTKKLAAE